MLFGVFAGTGLAGMVTVQWFRGNNCGGIAEVYEKGKGNQIQIGRVRLSFGQEVFTLGEHQFAVASEFIARYTKWNRWGGRVPTYRYELNAARPASEATQDVPEKGQQVVEKAFVDPKPSSASVNLIFRRGGLKAMIASTKSVAMDPRLVGVVCLIAGVAASYVLFSFIHPGLVPSPPTGYHFTVQPNPVGNSTAGSQGSSSVGG